MTAHCGAWQAHQHINLQKDQS